MRRSTPVSALLAALALAACSGADRVSGAPVEAERPREAAIAAAGACVEFNVPAFGTVYGSSVGTPIGALVFIENGIRVSVHQFQPAGGPLVYGNMRVENPPVPFGNPPVARSNNINIGFDFSTVGFAPQTVTLEWLDLGGVENLRVNGSPLWVGELHAPPAFLGGSAIASFPVVIPGGDKGTLKITGQTGRVWVGGQELWIDRVCAYP